MTDNGADPKVKCQFCGKWITQEESIENESGSYCRHLQEQGYSTESLREHRKLLTLDEIPEGFMKLASLDRICKKNGIPISRMVKAIGGDRALDEPVREEFRVVYVGNARYLSEWCASEEGLEFLRNMPSGRSTGKKKEKPADDLEKMLSGMDLSE